MSWPKPDTTPKEKPQAPKVRYWFIFLAIMLLVTFLVILIVKPSQPTREEVISYLTIFGAEFVAWVMFCSLRMLRFGIVLEYAEAWERELKKVDLSWNEWAERHLVVLGSYCALPEALSAATFLAQPSDKESKMDTAQALSFYSDNREINRQQQALDEVLFSQLSVLASLPVSQKITLEVFSIDGIPGEMINGVHAVWKALALPHPISVNVHSTAELSVLEDWIKHSDDDVKLVVVLQLESLQEVRAFTASEFVGALLLTNTILAASLELPSKAKLLRPMFSTCDELYEDLHQMHDVQKDMASVRHLWLTGFQGKLAPNLVGRLSELKVDLGQGQEKSGVHNIDLYQGLPGGLNGWLAIALASEAVLKTKEAQMAASRVHQEICLGVVLPA